jgi:hypothetical protein
MTHKRRMNFALASVALAVTAAVGGMASPPAAYADGVTVPLNTPFSINSPKAGNLGKLTIISASIKPDVDKMIRLDLGFKAEATAHGLQMLNDTFRLNVNEGSDKYVPTECSCKDAAANSTKDGTVSFVVPDKTTAATFTFRFEDATQEVPIKLDAPSIPAGPGSLGGDGVTVALNTPFSSGVGTYTITTASAKPDADGKTRLDLGFKAEAGNDTLYLDRDRTFRLQLPTETVTPTSCSSCNLVEARSTKTGTVSFLVPNTTKTATLIIKFEGGDKSVPITLNATGGTPSNGTISPSNGTASPSNGTAADLTKDSALAPPTIALESIPAGVAVNITDHSGVASNCVYTAPLVMRNFKLPANDSAAVKIVPLAKLGIPYPIHITCDNGAKLDTTALW